MGTIKNARRQTKWDKTQADLHGARDRSDHLLDRISAIEHAIVRLHGVRCPCGSREVVNEIGAWTKLNEEKDVVVEYKEGDIKCFRCHKLLEAYGVRG